MDIIFAFHSGQTYADLTQFWGKVFWVQQDQACFCPCTVHQHGKHYLIGYNVTIYILISCIEINSLIFRGTFATTHAHYDLSSIIFSLEMQMLHVSTISRLYLHFVIIFCQLKEIFDPL